MKIFGSFLHKRQRAGLLTIGCGTGLLCSAFVVLYFVLPILNHQVAELRLKGFYQQIVHPTHSTILFVGDDTQPCDASDERLCCAGPVVYTGVLGSQLPFAQVGSDYTTEFTQLGWKAHDDERISGSNVTAISFSPNADINVSIETYKWLWDTKLPPEVRWSLDSFKTVYLVRVSEVNPHCPNIPQ